MEKLYCGCGVHFSKMVVGVGVQNPLVNRMVLLSMIHANNEGVRSYAVVCSKRTSSLKIIVERPRNLSFGQVQQDETKKIRLEHV